jgi:hypothetical protein
MVLLDGIARIIGLKLMDATPENFNKTDFVHNRLYQRFASLEEMLSFYTPVLENSLQSWREAIDAAFCALARVDESRRQFFIDAFVVQIEIILGLYDWCHLVCLATWAKLDEEPEERQKFLHKAVYALEKLLLDRTKAEHGKWQHWYRGDRKMNLPGVLAKTKELLK